MKKNLPNLIACVIVLCAFTACGRQDMQPENTGTYTEKDNLKQAGLGAMVMLYDDSVWTYDEAQGTDASIVFHDADNSILGMTCSRESYYQHPLDMISTAEQICSGYIGYEEMEEPKPVSVQGEEWYEWIYQYTEGDVETIALQRFYAKNYYAYTITYMAEADKFEDGRNEALKVMNSAVMSVPDNAEAEEEAKKFLMGEWDLGSAGYLVMNEDSTYFWYMDGSKDEKNMHKGTYGCDVENAAAGFAKGEGIYFVLFPEVLYVEGKEGQTANAKYDYLVSLEQMEDGSYQMLNGSTLAMYSMVRQSD